MVGPEGRVLWINNPPYDAYTRKGLTLGLADGRLANVDYCIAPGEAMKLGDLKLDGALIVMSDHDLYVADPENGWPAIEPGQFIDQIARALKPGAHLLIVDHAAKAGTGSHDSQELHRIDEAFARSDFAVHGFELVASADMLRSKGDDRSRNVTDEAIKGRTDHFVHVYRNR